MTADLHKVVNFFISRYEKLRDDEIATGMKAYLKNKQDFLGIQNPARKEIYKDFKSEMGRSLKKTITPNDVESIVMVLWDKPEREYRYTALFLIEYFKTYSIDRISFLEQLIISGDWWDITDTIAPRFVGDLLKENKMQMKEILKKWVNHDNMWIRRSAILSQLKFKKNTDVELLSYCIFQTMNEKEFFIQKAIGWILREFSKTNPKFVVDFINSHNETLSRLSVREGSKYLIDK